MPQEKNRKLNGQLEGLLSEALDRDALELRLAKVTADHEQLVSAAQERIVQVRACLPPTVRFELLFALNYCLL